MAGQFSQSFNFLLIKGITVALGDQTLDQGGIAWQLEPAILPNVTQLEMRLYWRSSGFTAPITLKGIQAATPNVVVGTEVFSQTVSGDQWNDTGLFTVDVPVSREWITLVGNNPSLIGNADVDECMLYVEGLAAAGMASSFFNVW